MNTHRVRRSIGAAFVLSGVLVAALTVPAVGAPTSTAEMNATKGFRKGVTLAGVREHQAAFQAIADANDDTRVSGSAGYDESAAYVEERMEAAGYDVTMQEFEFDFFEETAPPSFSQVAPTPTTYVEGEDFFTMSFSGDGTATASVTVVDIQLGIDNTSTSGCDEDDFDGFPTGDIALMQRGFCPFGLKVLNAEAAGASGAVVFNQGNTDGADRQDLFGGTLGTPVGIPAVSVSYSQGVEFAETADLVLSITTHTISETRTTSNVIADSATGDPNHTIVVGAHLDSVAAGPGINDNGSGSATILEIAETYAAQGRTPRNHLRFMWYGAEESVLVGSTFYVNSLSEEELDQIELMLNFDMVGSPNYVRFVYDGDNSTGLGAVGPEGSGALEAMFTDYFQAVFGTATFIGSSPTPFNGRSDYGPFIASGIPAGGLFTGAEGIKTAEEAVLYGGTAGVAYDPCYHQACDTFANNSDAGLDQMSDAAAHVFLLVSKQNFAKSPLVDPAAAVGGAATGGGGGGVEGGALTS